MAVSIRSNVAALQVQRQLSNTASGVARAFERLSSGMRINRASDDAAGLAVSSVLNAQGREYGQGVRNLNDGLSYYSIADSALGELSNVVIRLKELAQQSANGTYSYAQRSALNVENDKLMSEFNRTVATARFNGVDVLNPLATSFVIHAGVRGSEYLNLSSSTELRRAVGNGSYKMAGSFTGSQIRGQDLTADIDGDGNLDIVSTGQYDGDLSVRFGRGDGSFKNVTSLFTITSSETINQIKTGDFNGDGKVDIAAVTDQSVLVAYNRSAAGVLSFNVTQVSDQTAKSVAVGDYNGDGRSDLAKVDGGGLTLSVYLTQSNGSFLKTLESDSVLSTNNADTTDMLVSGDFNGDGKADLACALSSGAVDILSGNGLGGFSWASTASGESSIYRLAVGDINHDGLDDLIGTKGGSSPNVLFFKALGGGNFANGVETGNFLADNIPNSRTYLRDMNGDGNLDILVAYGSGTNKFGLALGNGDGTFRDVQAFGNSSLNAINSLLLGDFDKDGVMDVIGNPHEEDTGGFGSTELDLFLGSATYTNDIEKFDLCTQAHARSAITYLDSLLTRLQNERGSIGAQQSRISAALSVVSAAKLNVTAAASRITDADIAQESSDLVRKQILMQTGASLLAQANQQPQLALSLLRA